MKLKIRCTGKKIEFTTLVAEKPQNGDAQSVRKKRLEKTAQKQEKML